MLALIISECYMFGIVLKSVSCCSLFNFRADFAITSGEFCLRTVKFNSTVNYTESFCFESFVSVPLGVATNRFEC